jgi:flagellar basal-body rod modification protein FlgD
MAATSFDSTLSNLGIKRTASETTAKAKASTTLDQSDFLTLMTAQLKNQDPFNPTDNTQMIAQMAQFSSVAGISSMNTTLTGIAAKLGATSANDAMAYVGKTVLTEGATAYPRTSGGIAGAVELAADATDVDVSIADANGNLLKSVSLGAQKAGTIAYDWDGKAGDGSLAEGPFTVTVTAGNNGVTSPAKSLVWAPVESVSLPSGGGDPMLSVTGIGSVKISAVRSAA